jgi:hypothetical protein
MYNVQVHLVERGESSWFKMRCCSPFTISQAVTSCPLQPGYREMSTISHNFQAALPKNI